MVANLEGFLPPEDDRRQAFRFSQRTAELAVALVCWRTHVPQVAPDARRRCHALLERVWESPAVMDPLFRSPDALSLVCHLYAGLRDAGADVDGERRACVERILEAGYLEQNERLPFRTMDIRLALEWCGLADGPSDWGRCLPGWDELCEQSILGQELKVPYLSDGAAYAYTHALFFATAFGMRPAPAPLAARAPTVIEDVSNLLVVFALEKHWDLVGEFLLCWESLRLPETPHVRRIWRDFLARQHEDGGFPGPRAGSDQGAPGGDPWELDFAKRYHTTLVAMMALTCRMANPARQDPASGGAASSGGAAPAPRPAALTCAAESARSWLEDLSCTADGGEPNSPEDLARILLGSIVAGEILGQSDAERRDLTRRVAGQLVRSDGDAGARWARTPAALRLLTAAILRSADVRVPELDAYADLAAAALASRPQGDPIQELDLHQAKLLLHILGALDAPTSPMPADAAAHVHQAPVTAESADRLVLLVEAASDLGRRPGGEGQGHVVGPLLEGVVRHHLRAYDLVRGCRAARALGYLESARPRAVREATAFLLQQQTHTGSFGRLGLEAADLARSDPEFSPVKNLLLPVTVDCLWTLAEAELDGWRLYGRLCDWTDPKAGGARWS